MEKKTLFLASSSMYPNYSLALKNALNESLEQHKLDVRCVWWKDEEVFQPNFSFFETLVNAQPAYAVALVTPDDTRIDKSDGKEYIIPRDNVIFEFGLFLGRLGREKTFLVTPNNTPDLQLMSDYKGVSGVSYSFSPTADVVQAGRDLISAVSRIVMPIYIRWKSLERFHPQEPSTVPDRPLKTSPYFPPCSLLKASQS